MPDLPPRAETGVLIRALAFEEKVRVVAAVVDGPAREICRRHGLDRGAALRMAEGLVATALQSAWIKGDEVITLQIQGTNPQFSLMAEVRDKGHLRGRIRPNRLPEVAAFDGYLLTLKSDPVRESYRSVAEIRDESIGGAFQRFVRDSAQVQAFVQIEAALDATGLPNFASGLLVERLPDADPEEVTHQLDALALVPFRDLMTAFAFGQLGGAPVEVLESRPLVHHCQCDRNRVTRVLRQLGKEDLRALLVEQGFAEVTCDFCMEVYHFDAAQVESIIAGG